MLGGRWDYRRSPPEGLPDDHPVAAGLAALRGYWEQRWWHSVSETVEAVVRERRLLELALERRRPRDHWRRIRFLLDQARAVRRRGRRAPARLRRVGAAAGRRARPGHRGRRARARRRRGAHPHRARRQGPRVPDRGAGRAQRADSRSRHLRSSGERPGWRSGSARRARATSGDENVDADRRLRDGPRHRGAARRGRAAAPAVRRGHPRARPPAGEPAPQGRDRSATRADRRAPRRPLSHGSRVRRPPRRRTSSRRPIRARGGERGRPCRVDRRTRPGARGRGPARVGRGDHARQGRERRARRSGAREGAAGADERPPWRRGRAGTAIGRAVHAVLQTVDLATGGGLPRPPVRRRSPRRYRTRGRDRARSRRACSTPRSCAPPRAATRGAGARCRLRRPSTARSSRASSTCSSRRPTGFVVVDYKTDQAPTDAELDAALAHYAAPGRGVRARARGGARPPGRRGACSCSHGPTAPSSARSPISLPPSAPCGSRCACSPSRPNVTRSEGGTVALVTISADSHVTEPGDCYLDRIDPKFRDRAPVADHRRHHGRGDGDRQRPQPHPLRHDRGGRTPRRDQSTRSSTSDGTSCTPAAGTRRRGSPSRTATASRPRCSTRRSGCCSATTPTPTTRRPASTRTTCGSPSSRPTHPTRLIGHRPDRAAQRRGGHRRPRGASKALGLRGRDAARLRRVPRRRRLRRPRWDPLWRAAVELGLPLSFHILTSGSQDLSGTDVPRPEDEQLPRHHPRLPGHRRHADLRRRLRAPPRPAGRLRRGRRRAGRRTGCTAPTTRSSATATGSPPTTLSRPPSEYFRENVYVTFQDDWVAFQIDPPDEPRAADVGERPPAQRRDLPELAAGPRRAHRAPRRTTCATTSCGATAPASTTSRRPWA